MSSHKSTVYPNPIVFNLLYLTARRVLLGRNKTEAKQHWHGVRLQGKLACVDLADHSVSHTMYKNAAIVEDVLKFTIKARLQALPTTYNLSVLLTLCLMQFENNMCHLVQQCTNIQECYQIGLAVHAMSLLTSQIHQMMFL